mmetsp:Transcript_9427/g.17699  ORF Transcript_9427/g.17699 Transcript_9427/m.17699 type:complete len:200 (+) Transcript_9427:862-1461(+)
MPCEDPVARGGALASLAAVSSGARTPAAPARGCRICGANCMVPQAVHRLRPREARGSGAGHVRLAQHLRVARALEPDGAAPPRHHPPNQLLRGPRGAARARSAHRHGVHPPPGHLAPAVHGAVPRGGRRHHLHHRARRRGGAQGVHLAHELRSGSVLRGREGEGDHRGAEPDQAARALQVGRQPVGRVGPEGDVDGHPA